MTNLEIAYAATAALVLIWFIVRGKKEHNDPLRKEFPITQRVNWAITQIERLHEFEEVRRKIYFAMVDTEDGSPGFTDGHAAVYLDRKYCLDCTDRDLLGLLLHELGHIALNTRNEEAVREYARVQLVRLGY